MRRLLLERLHHTHRPLRRLRQPCIAPLRVRTRAAAVPRAVACRPSTPMERQASCARRRCSSRYLSDSVALSLSLFLSVPACLPACLPAGLPVCLFLRFSFCLCARVCMFYISIATGGIRFRHGSAKSAGQGRCLRQHGLSLSLSLARAHSLPLADSLSVQLAGAEGATVHVTVSRCASVSLCLSLSLSVSLCLAVRVHPSETQPHGSISAQHALSLLFLSV